MNRVRIEGQWKQLKGKALEQWGQLRSDDVDIAAGRRARLAGRIQEHYGSAKEDAERQLAAWERRVGRQWARMRR